jgi:two-component system NtrC family sensor kinase
MREHTLLYSTRSKLIISFLGVSFLVGAVSLLVGGQLLYRAFLNEARNRVRLDLNAAREIYINRIKGIEMALNLTTLGFGFRSAFGRQDIPELVNRLRRLSQYAELDFAGIVTNDGETLCRIGPNSIPKKAVQATNPMASLALKRGVTISGTAVLSQEFLDAEDPALSDRARIKLLPTPRAAPKTEEEETSGMALAAAIPLFKDGEILGVLYGGVLLNRNEAIVDKVRETVFQDEMYKGHTVGTATIFFRDFRISTNVLTPEGNRAIGTRVSKEVRERVLVGGKKWIDRAFVVNDWYITAYEPIEDIFGERIGILYVGVLEAKYADIRNKALSVLILLTVAGISLAIGIGYFLEDKIMRPVRRLIKAGAQVSHGNLSPDIGPISKGEIGVVQKTFTEMITSLQERDRRLKAESEIKMLQSEKLASIGRFAAGVAHEINNPLTGVLTFTHMLLRRKDIEDEIRSDLQTIAESTERVRKIIKGLLDFSRQTKLDPEPTDVNRLVHSAVLPMENQALIKGIGIQFNPGENLPMLTLDRSQLQSVLINILINAIDATKPGGNITITTGMSVSAGKADQKGIEIAVTDTGCGIPPENLDKLFDPFFTTKEVGHGTGLGLAVSYGIVERHGGTIRVQSEVGRGSTFTIWLPIEE